MIGAIIFLALAGYGLWKFLSSREPYTLPYDSWWRGYDE